MESFTREIYAWIYSDLSLERIKDLKDKIIAYKNLYVDYNYYFENRPELVTRAIRHAVYFTRFCIEHDLNSSEKSYVSLFYPEITALNSAAYFLHSFNLLASPSQIAFYRSLIDSYQIIGSYAQTELGNGSDLRGIETQAIYDHSRQVFIINSPTITSSKFWVGGLGINSNFTLIIARLIIEDIDYGPHPFLMQIRNLRTHKPVEGAFLGEIGPKMGLESLDSGFSRFEFVTIPKIALLNRFWDIDSLGNYHKTIEPIKMISIVHAIARSTTIKNFWAQSASALTISLRYSQFRKQFPSTSNPNEEASLLTYQIQQHKLFPALSRLFCLIFCSRNLENLQKECIEKIINKDESLVEEFVNMSSLYKVIITNRTIEDIETCRRSCGGHGYLKLSGLPSLYANSVAAATFAGDNSVISIEFMKYLLKNKPKTLWHDVVNCANKSGHLRWLSEVAKFYLENIDKKYQKLVKQGISETEIWENYLQIDAIQAIEPLFMAKAYHCFESAVKSSSHQRYLELLSSIFAISELKKHENIVLSRGMSENEWEFIKESLYESYKLIEPEVLNIVNAFLIPDEILNSVLAKNDPYQEMIWTSKNLNPINTSNFSEKIIKHLRPKI